MGCRATHTKNQTRRSGALERGPERRRKGGHDHGLTSSTGTSSRQATSPSWRAWAAGPNTRSQHTGSHKKPRHWYVDLGFRAVGTLTGSGRFSSLRRGCNKYHTGFHRSECCFYGCESCVAADAPGSGGTGLCSSHARSNAGNILLFHGCCNIQGMEWVGGGGEHAGLCVCVCVRVCVCVC